MKNHFSQNNQTFVSFVENFFWNVRKCIANAMLLFGFSLIVTSHSFPLSVKEDTIFQDSETQDFLSRLVDPALKKIGMPKLTFYLIANPMINAFTAGEPSIFIHTGLIEKSASPLELAAVLLHEAGHIKGHHVIQRIAEIKRSQCHRWIPALAGLMAAGISGHWELAPLGMNLGEMSALATQLGHSRDHEYFADRFALQALSDINWPLTGFLDLMNKLARHDTADYPLYLRTHPFASDRLTVAKNIIHHKNGLFPEELTQLFQRTKIKIIAFFTPLGQAYSAVEKASVNPKIKDYGRAIVYSRHGKTKQALDQLKSFETNVGKSPFIDELRAQIFFESRDFEKALDCINQALKNRPTDPTFAGYKAQIIIEKGGPYDEAISLLERQLLSSLSVDHPELWYWLGIAYGRIKNMGRMKICMAEHALATNDLQKAVQLTNAALKILSPKDTYYQKAKDLESMLKREAQ